MKNAHNCRRFAGWLRMLRKLQGKSSTTRKCRPIHKKHHGMLKRKTQRADIFWRKTCKKKKKGGVRKSLRRNNRSIIKNAAVFFSPTHGERRKKARHTKLAAPRLLRLAVNSMKITAGKNVRQGNILPPVLRIWQCWEMALRTSGDRSFSIGGRKSARSSMFLVIFQIVTISILKK